MTVPTVNVLSGGKDLATLYELLSIDVVHEVNRIPYACVRLIDGNLAEQGFPATDDALMDAGTSIEIVLGFEGEGSTSVFTGIVVRQTLEAGSKGAVLAVELKDTAFKLTRGRKHMVFPESTDSDAIATVLKAANVKAGQAAVTKATHQELVQYAATDWDFIVSRAQANGLAVVVEAGKVSTVALAPATKGPLSLTYGIDEFYDIELELDTEHQFGEIESLSWDAKKHAPATASKAKPIKLGQDVDGKKAATAVGAAKCELRYPATMDPKEQQAWADGELARTRLSMIRGRISVRGTAEAALLDGLELDGVSARFTGLSLISGVRHRVDRDGWRTDIALGLSPQHHAERREFAGLPASGLLPPVQGLQVGIVDAFKEDPDGELRVRVILPAIDAKKASVWARLAAPDAGKAHGFLFRPEPGDEVVVGFFGNDPRHPVILGGMFSSKNKPPPELMDITADNIVKAIFSKLGTTIAFVDDKKASVFIETPNMNSILLDDDAQSISITDEHGNAITMDKKGITIKSAKDLTLDGASGNVVIKGKKVDVK